MGYKKEKIDIVTPKQGYDLIYKNYNKFHYKLDRRDSGLWQRYLPRDLKGKKVIDLGGGDCRLYKFFKNSGIDQYVVCDISENMMKLCPSRAKKIICDLDQDSRDIETDSFNIALAFFVLLHLQNLDNFFKNLYEILKPGGRAIILHHIERRPYVYKVNGKNFKIQTHTWTIEQIIQAASEYFFDIFVDQITNEQSYIVVMEK